MEQSKVVIYIRFTTDIEQEYVDKIKKEINSFVDMIGAKVMNQYWEVIPNGYNSIKFDAIFNKCISNRWGILTYDLKTLHKHKSGALSILEEGADVGVPIFFVDAESAFKSIFTL